MWRLGSWIGLKSAPEGQAVMAVLGPRVMSTTGHNFQIMEFGKLLMRQDDGSHPFG